MNRFVVLGAMALSLAGCVDKTVDGRALFAEECSACHGDDAKGGGVLAEGLTRQPPDLTHIAARNGGVFDINAVMSQIDGMHRAEGSPMPEFGAADMGEIIMIGRTPVPAELLALAGYLQSIQE